MKTHDDDLHEAAMIVVANDAVGRTDRAFSALRNSGFTTDFIGRFTDQIQERAAELADHYQIPSRVFLNTHGSIQ